MKYEESTKMAPITPRLIPTPDQHMQQAKEFQCPVCQKFFSRKFSLEMHLLIHKGVKPHACPFCGRCFRQKGTLMRHKALHSNTALFQCGLCNKQYRQKNVFLHHLKHTHKVSTENLDRRKCRTQLADHSTFSSASSLPPYVDSRTADHPTVPTHEAPSRSQVKNNWVCNVCSFQLEYFDQSACSYHLSLHKKEFPFECFQCCILFAKRSDLNLHLTECHLEGQPDTTSLQDLQLFYGSFQQGFDRTLANPDSSTSDVTFTCIPCQLDFHSEEDFECHVKTHVQSVLCDSSDGESVKSCGKGRLGGNSSAITSSCSSGVLPPDLLLQNSSSEEAGTPMDLLNAVVAGTHTVLEALSNIDSTGIQLPPHSDAQPRIIQETGTGSTEKPSNRSLYCCPFCDLTLNSKELLRRHSTTHLVSDAPVSATGERVYSCPQCPKLFSGRVSCAYHAQMHLSVVPFRCSLCFESFSRKSQLLAHTRRQHMKVHPCRKCGRLFQYRKLLRGHLKGCRSPRRESVSLVRAPVIDLSMLDSGQAKTILGVIPLKHSGSSASYGIPVVAPGQVGQVNLMLPVIGSVSLSPAFSFRRGSCF